MQAMITRLEFDSTEAAEEELAELDRQSEGIAALDGFYACYGIRTGPAEVVVIRIFDTAQGIGKSLAGPLRPDLAEHFSAPPQRATGAVVVARSR